MTLQEVKLLPGDYHWSPGLREARIFPIRIMIREDCGVRKPPPRHQQPQNMSIPKNNANGEAPELTSEEIAVVARWAKKVHLYAEDLYDQWEEALLRQILQKTDLEKLEPALKETLLNGLE